MRNQQDIEDELKVYAKKLRDFTKECRVDMHEPDEQGVSARVTGRYFDNAYGDSGYGKEKIVILKKGKKEFKINLATLIAVARLA